MIDFLSNLIDTGTTTVYTATIGPLIAAMCEVLQITQIIDNEFGYLHKNTKISLGIAIKALIINTLTSRTPLMHVEETFKHHDCEILFGKTITYELFNDDRLGRCLEQLGNSDINKLFSKICMNAIEQHNIIVKSNHVDTTNFSVYGSYESKDKETKDDKTKFKVTYGDPKSKRKDLKQFNMGLFVEQHGIPIGGNALSGNKSDAVWFRDALEELNEVFKGDLTNRPCFIFDAAGSNKTMFRKSDELKMPTIIRLSDSFSISEKYTMKTWEENSWSEIITLNNDKENKKKPSEYRLCEYEVDLEGQNRRLIIVHSYELEKLKNSTYSRNIVKNTEKLTKAFENLSKKNFKTKDSANEYYIDFIEKNTKLLKWFNITSNIEVTTVEKYEKTGRPAKDAKKIIIETYNINIQIIESNKEYYEKWIKKESCFVLISNVLKERYNTVELFREYKEQWVVENTFKFIKQPTVINSIWLKNEDRIKGLTFVLLLAVLVSTYTCYRLAKSLENNRELKSGPGRIVTTDGRQLTKASFKVIKQVLNQITIIITYNEKGEVIRKFESRTEIKKLQVIQMIGFSPEIYLRPYEIGMDIWNNSNVT